MIEFVFDRADLTNDKEYITLLREFMTARSNLLTYLEDKTKIRLMPISTEKKTEE